MSQHLLRQQHLCLSQSQNLSWHQSRIAADKLSLSLGVKKATSVAFFIAFEKIVSIDFFTVPTVTFQILYGFLVLNLERREVVYFNVTEHPTAQWTAQQMVEAFPWKTAPGYLLRDRDCIYGAPFRRHVHSLNMEEVCTAPRSPWQNPYVERLIGSIRRECLNHVIVLNERHLRSILGDYFSYYHAARTHLSLDKQCPKPRPVQLPNQGKIVSFPHLGGLHHEYRRAA